MNILGRYLGIAVVTLITAIVVGGIASGVFNAATAGCSSYNFDHPCPDTTDAVHAIAFLGAVGGFWFAYTGRLARLFRKV